MTYYSRALCRLAHCPVQMICSRQARVPLHNLARVLLCPLALFTSHCKNWGLENQPKMTMIRYHSRLWIAVSNKLSVSLTQCLTSCAATMKQWLASRLACKEVQLRACVVLKFGPQNLTYKLKLKG
jgi:hypothetical protein